jgi:hypothetical protein
MLVGNVFWYKKVVVELKVCVIPKVFPEDRICSASMKLKEWLEQE